MAFYYSKLLEAKVFKNSCCSVIDKCHEMIVMVNITVRDQQMLSLYQNKSFIPDEFAYVPNQILRAMKNDQLRPNEECSTEQGCPRYGLLYYA